MPGPSEQSSSGEILDFFDATPSDPFSANEIASETGYPVEQIRNELHGLVDREHLRTRVIDGSKRVWWLARPDGARDEPPESLPGLTDASDGRDSRAGHRRLLEQHRQLAHLITRIDITDDLDEILRQITVEARKLVGAHQAVTSRTVGQNWAQAINEVSLSEKHADFRDYDTEPDGSGIYSLVCERNEPIRLPQAELESHPAWKAFGDEVDEHPPMDGWLAVPIVGSNNENQGLIQLSDKYHGEFTDADEAILIQLANVASAAIENAQLYDELRESEERYRTLVENFPNGGVGVYDDQLRYTLVTGTMWEDIQPDAEDLEGHTIHEALPPATADDIEPLFRAALEGDTGSVVSTLGGRTYRVWATPLRDTAGEVTGGQSFAVDITDQLERERQLAESERRYRTLAEYFPNGIVTLFDQDLRYELAAGQAFEDISVDPGDVEGHHLEHVWGDATAEQLRPAFEAALDGEEQSVELKYEGREWVVHAVPITDERGDVFAGMTMAQDITERKARERRLEDLVERLEASNERLEQFAYAASHDLQEPLRMVSSYLLLLEQRYRDELDEDAEEFIEFAVDGADRMREMIEGLLRYSRIDSQGEPFEPVDLNAVIADVCQDMHMRITESGAEITAEELPTVYGDGSQLNQVFQNLLNNAIEYSGDDPPRVHVDAERANSSDQWVISVSDEGVGIDPADQDRIFEVFQRLHSRDDHAGTGIGLALCERIVERHGGGLWVESEPGAGATFSFTLEPTDRNHRAD